MKQPICFPRGKGDQPKGTKLKSCDLSFLRNNYNTIEINASFFRYLKEIYIVRDLDPS